MQATIYRILLESQGDGMLTETTQDIAEEIAKALQNESQILTCIYCGHQYPPGTPNSNHVELTNHIAQCEKHPLKIAVDALKYYATGCGASDAGGAWELWDKDNYGERARTALGKMGIDVEFEHG